jgi:hypothetical protein
MSVMAAVKAFNQKARNQNWHQFCDPTLAFSDPAHLKMLSIWRAKAGDRAMPSRSEMGARDLKDFLRNLVLFERDTVNHERFVWRLAGTGVTDILGHHTGKTFEESVPPQLLPRWIESMSIILDNAQPMRFIGRVHINGREYLHAEHLYLPLANDNDVPTFIMGFCHYTPRRAEEEESWENQIASIPGGLL